MIGGGGELCFILEELQSFHLWKPLHMCKSNLWSYVSLYVRLIYAAAGDQGFSED